MSLTLVDILLNVFEAVDVIELLRDGDYSNLNWTVGKALSKRNPNHPGVYTCTLEDGESIMSTFVEANTNSASGLDTIMVRSGLFKSECLLNILTSPGHDTEEPCTQIDRC